MIFPSVVVAGGAPEIEFQHLTSDPTNATSYSFTSVPFGDAHPRRYIVAFVMMRGPNYYYPTTVTIGGVAADQHGAFWVALVPTGTTGTIAVTTIALLTEECIISVWSAKRLRFIVPIDTADAFASAAIDVRSRGAVIGVVSARGTVTTMTTLVADDEIPVEASLRITAGTYQSPSDGTITVTASHDATPNNPRIIIASIR